MSPRSQMFWGYAPPDYCVWPKSDNFSYIGPLSSISNLDHVVVSFGSHEVKVLTEGFYSGHLPISTRFYSSPLTAQNTESNWFSYRDWKNVSSESFIKVVDEMLNKIKVPFNLLCDRAVLPQSEKNISVELTFYFAQINNTQKCAEISAVPLRCVRKSFG